MACSLVSENKILRAIPLKKQDGRGRKFSVTPSDKIGICSTPWTKTGIFFSPLGHKTGFVYPPPTCFVHVTPSDSFVQFYPPRTVFSADFTPLGHFFCQIYPLEQLFHPFYPLRHFFDDLTPTFFS